MSTRYNNGSHYKNHQRAAELHDAAAHAHHAAALQGKGEHLTAHEHSRQALEHSLHAHQQTQAISFGHDRIAALAHSLWHARGCPQGSPHQDWLHALEILRTSTP
jgi:hypothetical protein